MYKFSKSDRLFLEGAQQDDFDKVTCTRIGSESSGVVHAKRKLSTEILGSSIESTKTSRRGEKNTRRIVTRIIRKTTTLTHGEENYVEGAEIERDSPKLSPLCQYIKSGFAEDVSKSTIADIIVGQDSSTTAREALLRWAQLSTAHYPGVRISDFTSSWRDGLAFVALLHRNRPDLVDWRSAQNWHSRERIDHVFHTFDVEYNVTRLLDSEDVDTSEADEKSLITYISSLYDVFPQPPLIHPLFDAVAQQKLAEYHMLAKKFHLWLIEKISLFQDVYMPPSLIEINKMSTDMKKFIREDIPNYAKDFHKLSHLFTEMKDFFESIGRENLEEELHIKLIEKKWNLLLDSCQERDKALTLEAKRLECVQKKVEKIHREIKFTDHRLEELENQVDNYGYELTKIHPLEAKQALDILEIDMRSAEVQIQNIFGDINCLTDWRYSNVVDLQKRGQKLHHRWVALRSSIHTRLVEPLSSVSFPMEERVVTKQRTTIHESRLVETNPHFRALYDCIDYCKNKIAQLKNGDYGSDIETIQTEIENIRCEYKAIETFQTNLDNCMQAKAKFSGDELKLYGQLLTELQRFYAELSSFSCKKMSDLEILLDFVKSATSELYWVNSKEEIEVTRDWSEKNLSIQNIEKYYESLMGDLERRELQFSAVQDRGEGLILQNHPAIKTIEAYMSAMQHQWAWLLQLTHCMEVHLQNALTSQQFSNDINLAVKWIEEKKNLLNRIYSQTEFNIDEGEVFLKGMQDLRDELNKYGDHVRKLVNLANQIVPLHQRRYHFNKSTPVTCICHYENENIKIERNEICTLFDSSARIKWKVKNLEGEELSVFSVCFSLPPPDENAIHAIEKLQILYEDTLALWQQKQLRLRQCMIFATIKVVKVWSFQQFIDMGIKQRSAIKKALNDDAGKLLTEGDSTDPQLKRLKREMTEVNKLFDEFEKRAKAEEESKILENGFNEKVSFLKQILFTKENELNRLVENFCPKNLNEVNLLISDNKKFKESIVILTDDIEKIKVSFHHIIFKTSVMKSDFDKILTLWNCLLDLNRDYSELLKSLQSLLSKFRDTNEIISDFESAVLSNEKLPTNLKELYTIQEKLLCLKNSVVENQITIDQLRNDLNNFKSCIEKIRKKNLIVPNSNTLDEDFKAIDTRWINVCQKLEDMLLIVEKAHKSVKSCEISCQKQSDNCYDQSIEFSFIPILAEVTEKSGTKQGIESKYYSCLNEIENLLQWITEVEDKLAHQEVLTDNSQMLRDHNEKLKVLKNEVKVQSQRIVSAVEQVRQMFLSCSDTFLNEELSALDSSSRSLKHRYNIINEKLEGMLKKGLSAYEELEKYRFEVSNFSKWLEETDEDIDGKEKNFKIISHATQYSYSIKTFVSDVIAHQADLRFIAMSAQKFLDESKEYLSFLNEFRTSLPQRLPYKQAISAEDSLVMKELAKVTNKYSDVLQRSHLLSESIANIVNKQRENQECIEKVNSWLECIEAKVQSFLQEPVEADPKQIDKRLMLSKQIHCDIVSNERLIRAMEIACKELLELLEPSEESDIIQEVVEDLRNRYKTLKTLISNKCHDLDASLIQSQSVQDALDSVSSWLIHAEGKFNLLNRPISLNRGRLEEQQREHSLFQVDLDNHRASIEAISNIRHDLEITSCNNKVTKHIDDHIKDIQNRYEKLVEKFLRRHTYLTNITEDLLTFFSECSAFESWYESILESIESNDVFKLEATKYQELIVKWFDKFENNKDNYEEIIRIGKTIASRRDLSDAALIRDKISSIESQWDELYNLIKAEETFSKLLFEKRSDYETLRSQVMERLCYFEERVQKLSVDAINLERISEHIEHVRATHKEYREFGSIISKLNDLGVSFNNMLKEHNQCQSKHQKDSSFSKRFSTTTNKILQKEWSSLPSKHYTLYSPLTPCGSSRFSSRRSSQDYLYLDELFPICQQLSEINNRNELLGVRIIEQLNELDSVQDEFKKYLENLKELLSFLDKIEEELPKEIFPDNNEELIVTIRQLHLIAGKMYEKQSLLDNTKFQYRNILKERKRINISHILSIHFEDAENRWKALSDKSKQGTQFLSDVKEYFDMYDLLDTWLCSKHKMIEALGPISSDSRVVTSQVQQVQVLREEFRTQQPQLDHFAQIGENIISRLYINSEQSQEIKLKKSKIFEKWHEQLKVLEERAQNLGDAVHSSRGFEASLNRLQCTLNSILENLDEELVGNDLQECLRKIENIQRQLDGQRSLLGDAHSASIQLCEVFSDPAKSEIQEKYQSVEKLYNSLQKKLDIKRNELEENLKEFSQFEGCCGKTICWLADELNNMSENLLISASRDILQQQINNHEPIYRNVISKEYEIIMLLNNGQQILAKSGKVMKSSMQRELDRIQSLWDKLKKGALDRHTKLQRCSEYCKKYHKYQNSFVPWLRKTEDKVENFRSKSVKRKDVEIYLKELSSFRYEVLKKCGEMENLQSVGEAFVNACDIDKEVVNDELKEIRIRWENLNIDFTSRIQSLEDTVNQHRNFNEMVRELDHQLQRCEDKLASHDALGGDAKDPKLLERLKILREEAAKLRVPIRDACLKADDIMLQAAEQGIDATYLKAATNNILGRVDDLQIKLDDRYNLIQSAATAIMQFNDFHRSLSNEMSQIENDIDFMKPPERNIKYVQEQIEALSLIVDKLNKLSSDIKRFSNNAEYLLDCGFTVDGGNTRYQVDTIVKRFRKLEVITNGRNEELQDVMHKLKEFLEKRECILCDVDNLNKNLIQLKPLLSDLLAIRSQQDDLRSLKINKIDPIDKTIKDVNDMGQRLIKSAHRGINTSTIEKDLDTLNEMWSNLKEKFCDMERKLDIGLLQSGKFQEALDCFEKWLLDTENMVSNQKPASSNYKVIKAQLQEQKFLNKMLVDRESSMTSLSSMCQELASNSELKECQTIENQLEKLIGRFSYLKKSSSDRMNLLQKAMNIAEEFESNYLPLSTWLDQTEKIVKDMELVPTEEEKINSKINQHNLLHKEILARKLDFSRLTDIASVLMDLVGEDEATSLADKLQEVADRYAAVVKFSDILANLLQWSKKGLRHLVLTYQDLQAWMEDVETKLSQHKVFAIQTEKLLLQIKDLKGLHEEILVHKNAVSSTTESGLELMKHISNDEALQLKEKIDFLQRRFSELDQRCLDLLKYSQDTLPLVRQFHDYNERIVDWMQCAETCLHANEHREDIIIKLELEIMDYRLILDKINTIGPQLCQIAASESAATIEGLIVRNNRRFDAIVEQIQRRAERMQLCKQRSLEVVTDIDDLLEWFREADSQLRDAELPSSEPEVIRIQVKEHRSFNDDISSQKGRVKDIISCAKKVARENTQSEDAGLVRDKIEELQEIVEIVSSLTANRLDALEQALPLAEHFRDAHSELIVWFEEIEKQVSVLPIPALRPDLIAVQQDKNEQFMQSVHSHKVLIDKVNKTGEALIKLCNLEDNIKVQETLENINARYFALRSELRIRQQVLDQALQESSHFAGKLDGMLRTLTNTDEQINSVEPISAHPSRLRDQMEENIAFSEEFMERCEAFDTIKKAANDIITKASNNDDPAVHDVKRKLEKLNNLWENIKKTTLIRRQNLDCTLLVAEKFWTELHSVMNILNELQDALVGQSPPGSQLSTIQEQQVSLHEIGNEIDETKSEVEQVKASGHELMNLCGEPDKPEVRKHIEELDEAWENVTTLYAKREENLIHAMEKSMEFHDTLRNLEEFFDKCENKFSSMAVLGSDIDEVKLQLKELDLFKSDVDPHMVQIEALNRQATELTDRVSSEQCSAIKEPLAVINKRWEALLRGVVDRQRLLENALLRLGQFQHALDEILIWIEKTEKMLCSLKPVAGEPQVIEVELAKLKVLVNDIQAHQTSVDTLNDAGSQLVEDGKDANEASVTSDKLANLNLDWKKLLECVSEKQSELEDALQEAQSYISEIQDFMTWLNEIDATIVSSKPVGGLPETASEQLERFMELYRELEQSRPKVDNIILQGQEILKHSSVGASGILGQSLRTLKQRWSNVNGRATDKKIKLEIALKEAVDFHDALKKFVDWLSNAEIILNDLKPVSRVMQNILEQVEEHKNFQKDVGIHREIMLNLDKKGTHLKYFSQKQDVILIKNLLISVQHRWERVVSKSAERTRALDYGYKEAKEFYDSWLHLITWLDNTNDILNEFELESFGGNDPKLIKIRLHKLNDIQKNISDKQSKYEATMRCGKLLREKAPKLDDVPLKESLNELKTKWSTLLNKSIERQRKLEEALLFSGQFMDAIDALHEWLQNTKICLSNIEPVHGDLDTVTHLIEQHNSFENDLKSRANQVDSVTKTGKDLECRGNNQDASIIRKQLNEILELWEKVINLSSDKSLRLNEALNDATELHNCIHMLLEWLNEVDEKLRLTSKVIDEEEDIRNKLSECKKILEDIELKKIDKTRTEELANKILLKAHANAVPTIEYWLAVLDSRWEEISAWAHQCFEKMQSHWQSLKNLDKQLEELLVWLEGLQSTLIRVESEPLPDERSSLKILISQHKEFMENTALKQNEIDQICKARGTKMTKDSRKVFKPKLQYTRMSPGRDKTPDPSLPHIGPRFSTVESKGLDLELRNPKIQLLWDKWRNVWMLAWERQRRLQDKLNYVEELERVANFSWEAWRKKFLKFMNHKKSRLTDLFRKMDKNNDGLIPRDYFIQGILNTKFETSKLEMGAVSDLFDRNGEGLIDWKEFIAALRPDWEERRNYNENDKIHDEVKRLVMLCTCRQKFRVFQVGEGKYRFGDSQKLRLVRILRSTVMVRVGGGWVALDEFLVKNDPCRAKGRTNIELREQFILADGVSQTMTAFRSKPYPNAALQRNQFSTTGPITKVRERSIRSTPMGSSKVSKASLATGTPDSLSDNESISGYSPPKNSLLNRSSLTPGGSRPTSRIGTRPSSHHGSKPSSRYASTQSLDSTDESCKSSKIPRRKSASNILSKNNDQSRMCSTEMSTSLIRIPTRSSASAACLNDSAEISGKLQSSMKKSNFPSLHSKDNHTESIREKKNFK